MNLLQWTCIRTGLIFLIIASLVGCGKTESENVESQGVHARIDAIAVGDGNTDVRARLQVGDGGLFRTDLVLSSGDRLVAYANGLPQVMSEISSIFGASHITTFPFDNGGALFQVAFERSSKTSAPNSNVTLPDSFTITTVADLVYADTDAVSVNWEPFNKPDKMSIEYHFDCEDINNDHHFGIYALATSDSGQRDMPVTEILTRGGNSSLVDFTNGCDLEIEVVRHRDGNLDRNYGDGGRIYAQQRRMVEARIAAPP